MSYPPWSLRRLSSTAQLSPCPFVWLCSYNKVTFGTGPPILWFISYLGRFIRRRIVRQTTASVPEASSKMSVIFIIFFFCYPFQIPLDINQRLGWLRWWPIWWLAPDPCLSGALDHYVFLRLWLVHLFINYQNWPVKFQEVLHGPHGYLTYSPLSPLCHISLTLTLTANHLALPSLIGLLKQRAWRFNTIPQSQKDFFQTISTFIWKGKWTTVDKLILKKKS